MITQKTCTKCGECKSLGEFYRDSSKSDGLRARCKKCVNESNNASDKRNATARRAYNKAYYIAHKEEAKYRSRVWNENNRERKSERDRQYASENKDRIAANLAQWKAENPNYMKDWYAANPEYNAEWKRQNADKVKKSTKRQYEKRKDDPKFRLESAMRSGVAKGIKKGSKSARRTFDLLGYSLGDLMAHLELQFRPGMSWENYGEWHIDHKIPLSAHNYKTPDDIDFKRAWSLSNLQPLWRFDNISKHAKLDDQFQPALAFSA